MLGYHIMANKSSKWSVSNKLLFSSLSPCFSLYTESRLKDNATKYIKLLEDRLHRYGCFVRSLFLIQRQRHKQSNSLQGISCRLCRPLTRALPPQYITSPTTSCTHTFFLCCCLPKPLSHISFCLSPAQFVSLFSHIFYTFIFLYFYISSVYTFPLLCVNHFRQSYIFMSVSLILSASRSS